MNSDDKNLRLVELLHDLTQKGFRIEFSEDFAGMLTVNARKRVKIDTWEPLGHQHLGIPYQSMKDLEKYVRNYLALILEEG